MRSAADRNVVMRRIPVFLSKEGDTGSQSLTYTSLSLEHYYVRTRILGVRHSLMAEDSVLLEYDAASLGKAGDTISSLHVSSRDVRIMCPRLNRFTAFRRDILPSTRY
jgi:hypothetical protein